MILCPYLNFDGRCEEAFLFYAELLGGTIEVMMKQGDSPMADSVAPEARDRIMHARLTVGDWILLASDAPAEVYQPPRGIYVMADRDEPVDAERVFHALAEGGRVAMPIQETFWALRFGIVIDRFGIPWMVNCDRPM